MATKAELRSKVAQTLGILPIGQTLASQHQTRIDEAYDEVYNDLREEGLNVWASDGECPDRVTPWMVAYMASTLTEDYPISEARYVRIMNKAGTNGDRAKREIRRVTTPAYVSTDEPQDY